MSVVHRENKKKKYRKLCDDLRQALGGRCCKCRVKRKRPLHFDIKVPVDNGYHHRKLGPLQRIKFYWQQYSQGNVRILCDRCNGHKGATKDKSYYARLRYEQEIEAEGQALASMVLDEVPF